MDCQKILDEILEGLKAQREAIFNEHSYGWNTALATLSEVIDYVEEVVHREKLNEKNKKSD
jgi:hypothetical protein